MRVVEKELQFNHPKELHTESTRGEEEEGGNQESIHVVNGIWRERTVGVDSGIATWMNKYNKRSVNCL